MLKSTSTLLSNFAVVPNDVPAKEERIGLGADAMKWLLKEEFTGHVISGLLSVDYGCCGYDKWKNPHACKYLSLPPSLVGTAPL